MPIPGDLYRPLAVENGPFIKSAEDPIFNRNLQGPIDIREEAYVRSLDGFPMGLSGGRKLGVFIERNYAILGKWLDRAICRDF